MREILFRAKTTVKEDKNHAFNNVWVEGDLIVSNGRYYIHPRANKVNVENEVGKLIVMHEVQKDTVCEYTGLKDKNGKEIYENDIVKVSYVDWEEEYEEISVVNWYEYGYFPWMNQFDCEGCDLSREIEDIEVIGNVFDNPELLERGAE